jgi:peptide/nickel transport system ATP-binding protein
VVEKAPTKTLFAEMRHPYTEALVRSIPKLADPSHTRLITIGGRPPNLISPPTGCRFSPRCPYVQDKCLEEEPPLLSASTPGHEFRCWFPVGTPEGKAALERNRVAAAAALVDADPATKAAVAATGNPIADAPGVN